MKFFLRQRSLIAALAAMTLCLGAASPARADEAVNRGVNFLLGKQLADGSWGADTSFTGLAVRALLESGIKESHSAVAKAIQYLLSHQQPDGGIYIKERGLANYSTSICIIALKATGNSSHGEAVRKALQFTLGGQMDEKNNVKKDNPFYGGAGYGSKESKSDMSNSHFMLEAWKAAGLSESDPAWERAVVFLDRCQNRKASNDQPYAGDDGGFVYSPVESKAGELQLPDGRKGLRSYASMTYAGLLSFIYANVKRDDPRVQAAYEWLKKNYSLDENPGIGAQGLFYYYHTMAKALDVYGGEVFVDSRGTAHQWRQELRSKLVSQQAPDGSWTNSNSRWMENDPVLVTAYSLLALARTNKT